MERKNEYAELLSSLGFDFGTKEETATEPNPQSEEASEKTSQCPEPENPHRFYRPCLTQPELQYLVLELAKLSDKYLEELNSTKDEDRRFELNQHVKACEGLLERFDDLLNGKKKGRIKKDAKLGQIMCRAISARENKEHQPDK